MGFPRKPGPRTLPLKTPEVLLFETVFLPVGLCKRSVLKVATPFIRQLKSDLHLVSVTIFPYISKKCGLFLEFCMTSFSPSQVLKL